VLIYEFQLSNSVQEEYKTKKGHFGVKVSQLFNVKQYFIRNDFFFYNLNILPHVFE